MSAQKLDVTGIFTAVHEAIARVEPRLFSTCFSCLPTTERP
jgi:hypothetical protein